MALGYRMNHPPGSVAWQFDSTSGEAYNYEFATTSQTVNGTATDVITRDANMVPQPKLDASGKPVPYHVDYPYYDNTGNFLTHPNAKSVIASAQMGLGFRSGHGRHSDSRWIRILHVARRRGQERQTGHSQCGHPVPPDSRGVLLPHSSILPPVTS